MRVYVFILFHLEHGKNFEMDRWNNGNNFFSYKFWIYLQCNFFYKASFVCCWFIFSLLTSAYCYCYCWCSIVCARCGGGSGDMCCWLVLWPCTCRSCFVFIDFFSRWYSVMEFCPYTAVVQVVNKRYAYVSAEFIFLKVME